MVIKTATESDIFMATKHEKTNTIIINIRMIVYLILNSL